MIVEVEGSLLKDIKPYSVLLHQVNCLGKMGAGLAAQMSKKFNGLWQSYHEYCMWFQEDYNHKSHRYKILGTWHIFRPEGKDDLIICNAFGQEFVSRDKQTTDYNAWNKIFSKLEKQTRLVNEKLPLEKQWTIHAPYNMGCGLGGGDWDKMMTLIKLYFENSPIKFVIHKI